MSNNSNSNTYQIPSLKLTPKRHSILRKTNYKCGHCGCELTYENCSFDHIIPQIKNGENSQDNLIAACKSCNHSKRDKTLEDFRNYKACNKAVKEAGFSFKQINWLIDRELYKEIGGIPNFKFYFETLK